MQIRVKQDQHTHNITGPHTGLASDTQTHNLWETGNRDGFSLSGGMWKHNKAHPCEGFMFDLSAILSLVNPKCCLDVAVGIVFALFHAFRTVVAE